MVVATDIEYGLINAIIFAYIGTIVFALILWHNRKRINRAVHLWLRPDLKPDTPRQYHRHSRSHYIGGNNK